MDCFSEYLALVAVAEETGVISAWLATAVKPAVESGLVAVGEGSFPGWDSCQDSEHPYPAFVQAFPDFAFVGVFHQLLGWADTSAASVPEMGVPWRASNGSAWFAAYFAALAAAYSAAWFAAYSFDLVAEGDAFVAFGWAELGLQVAGSAAE